MEKVFRAAVVVGDAWPFNKVVPTCKNNPPIKPHLQIKELSCYPLLKKICVSLDLMKSFSQTEGADPYWNQNYSVFVEYTVLPFI